jgi:hypothetical protein
MASVLNMNPLNRHLRATRLLQNHPRLVIQIIASALRTARPRISRPLDQAGGACKPDQTIVQTLACDVFVRLTCRADDLEGHLRQIRSPYPRTPRCGEFRRDLSAAKLIAGWNGSGGGWVPARRLSGRYERRNESHHNQ